MQVGPFTLQRQIGSGGMGTVWRADSVAGVPVAVKVLAGRHQRSTRYQVAFRREVRAIVALHHPGVVSIYDHGRLDEHVGDGLVEGSPWLAMELARDSLGSDPPWGWTRLRIVLVQILEALAHVHARNIVHCDLKPENLLWRADEHVVLTDFGVAWRRDEPEAFEVAGTPAYMAPEQFTGDPRLLGPWTDLYALGCTTFHFCSGRPPFVGTSGLALASAHTFEPVPALACRFPVPAGLDAFVAKLLGKKPNERYVSAAHALAALRGLEGELVGVTTLSPARTHQDDELEWATTARWFGHGDFAEGLIRSDLADTEPGVVPTVVDSRAATHDTRLSADLDPQAPLDGSATALSPLQALDAGWAATAPPTRPRDVGLGLLPLRESRFVGRQELRESLWAALRQVCRERVANVVALVGEPGVGKTRLAREVAYRACEVGAAQAIFVEHDIVEKPRHGIAAALARHIGCAGLDGEATWNHLRRMFAGHLELEDDLPALHALVFDGSSSGNRDVGREMRGWPATSDHAPGDQADESERPRFQFSSESHRHRFAWKVIVALSRTLPVLVVLDDIQWALDALDFLAEIGTRRNNARVLIVATARAAELAANEAAQLVVDEYAAEVWPVLPLEPREQRQLISDLLTVAPPLADALVRRSQGNPLFAVSLLVDWARQGELSSAESGFVADEVSTQPLPADIHELWLQRVDRSVARTRDPNRARQALDLVATAGRGVSQPEWDWIARHVGRVDHLLDVLLDDALLVQLDDGFELAHGLLVDALLKDAIERGDVNGSETLAHRELTVAEMVLATAPRGAARDYRVAVHLAAGGALPAALERFHSSAHAALTEGRFRLAEAVLKGLFRALGRAGVKDDDPRRATGLSLSAERELVTGRLHEAERLLATAQKVVEGSDLRARAHIARASACISRFRGEFDAALTDGREWERLARLTDDDEGVVRALYSKALVELQCARLSECEESVSKAVPMAIELGLRHWVGQLYDLQCSIETSRLNLDAAEHLARSSFEEHRATGNYEMMACALIGLGEVHRIRGDLDEARSCYERALQLHEPLSLNRQITRLNLALVDAMTSVEPNELGRVLDELGELAGQFAAEGFPDLVAIAHLAQIVAATALGWRELAVDCSRAVIGIIDGLSSSPDIDLGLLGEMAAATLATVAPAEAAALFRRAATHLELCGHGDAAEAARQRAAELASVPC